MPKWRSCRRRRGGTHHASTLLAILNHAKAERIIPSHQLEGVRVPRVPHDDEPQPWSQQEVAVIMGPAMAEYEREQAAWNALVAKDKKHRSLRCPFAVPLRGFCLIAYLTLMRPKNNFALTWEELSFHAAGGKSWFNLDQHKNVNKGIKARGGLAADLVAYLLSIRPANARGLIHPNPATGKAYTDIRKQWKRLALHRGTNARLQANRQAVGVLQLPEHRTSRLARAT